MPWQGRARVSHAWHPAIYLNPRWSAADGGGLQIYGPSSETPECEVMPIGGRLVLFDSRTVEHAVAATQSQRFALTYWAFGPPGYLAS